jgi:hypothetical protein
MTINIATDINAVYFIALYIDLNIDPFERDFLS